MSPVVRPAQAADESAIDALALRLGLQVDAGEQRKKPQTRLIVAEDSEQGVIGFALAWCVAGEMEILDLGVFQSFRRRGIGAKLVAALLSEAQSSQCFDVFLEVRRSNQGAIALYLSQQFKRVGERAGYYRDGEDALLFRCCLQTSS